MSTIIIFLIVLSTVDQSSEGQSGAKGECFIDVRGWTHLQNIHEVYTVQYTLFAAFEITNAARGFKINLYEAGDFKKVGQHYVMIGGYKDCIRWFKVT